MEIHSAAILYFSPTGSTYKILQAVIEGMDVTVQQMVDLTSPEVRNAAPPTIEGEILILGAPVYGMGVPRLLVPFLRRLQGHGQPAVLITVYGNVDEGTALEELAGLAEQTGFKPIAAGSFIGEHSLSTGHTPIGKGRPDRADLDKAREFGRQIREKVSRTSSGSEIPLALPRQGNLLTGKVLPYLRQSIGQNDGTKTFTLPPLVDLSRCSSCGICARHCPMGAIDPVTFRINERLCFHCFSCAKRCPKQARQIIYRPGWLVSRVMAAKARIPKAPHVYL